MRKALALIFDKERFKHFSVYAIYGAVFFGAYILVANLIPHGSQSKTTTNVGKADKVVNITHNEAPERRQGLYVALTSVQTTVGVFKQLTDNFRVSLGAGETYEGEAVAEVRGEVSF